MSKDYFEDWKLLVEEVAALRTKVTELEAESTWGPERSKLLAKVQDDNEELEAEVVRCKEEMAEHKYARAIAEAEKEAMQKALKCLCEVYLEKDELIPEKTISIRVIKIGFSRFNKAYDAWVEAEQALKEDTDDGN